MGNPVMDALLVTRANERLQALRYEPPASWTKEAKLAFLHLPPEIQIYYVAREKNRDGEVKRCQKDRADACKALAATQQQLDAAQQELAALKQSKEAEDGNTKQDTAAA